MPSCLLLSLRDCQQSAGSRRNEVAVGSCMTAYRKQWGYLTCGCKGLSRKAYSGHSPFHLGRSHVSSIGNTGAGISWSCGWRWSEVGAEPAFHGKSWWADTSETSTLGWILILPQKMYCWNRDQRLKWETPLLSDASHPSSALPPTQVPWRRTYLLKDSNEEVDQQDVRY